MTSRPRGSITSNINRRMTVSDVDRMRAFGSSMPSGSPDFQAVPLSMNYLNSGTNSIHSTLSDPPPIPPRSDVSRYNNRYSNYSNMYSPYSRYSPGMYSTYGAYRTPYSRYGMPGMPHDSYNSFIQLAEESTRPAFESIESVVDIVGSISMMLESTYHAVYSSYNAILGVVDQFSRLRDHLAEVLSFLALLRGLKYLCLKILYLLRLKKDNPSVEAAWYTARTASEHSDFSQFHHDRKAPWPFFMFVGLVIGAPWLMFKLLSRSVTKRPFDLNSWRDKGGYLICQANYSFNTSRRGELSFSTGEYLYIAPKHLQTHVPRGWALACNRNNKVGLVPANYLKGQQTSSGQLRVTAHRLGNLSSEKCSKVPVANDAKAEVGSEEAVELPKDIPVNPFVPDDPVTPEIVPVPPITEESSADNEEH